MKWYPKWKISANEIYCFSGMLVVAPALFAFAIITAPHPAIRILFIVGSCIFVAIAAMMITVYIEKATSRVAFSAEGIYYRRRKREPYFLRWEECDGYGFFLGINIYFAKGWIVNRKAALTNVRWVELGDQPSGKQSPTLGGNYFIFQWSREIWAALQENMPPEMFQSLRQQAEEDLPMRARRRFM